MIFVGKVLGVYPGKGKAEGKVVNVNLSCSRYDKEQEKEVSEKIEIPFWNSQKEDDVLEDKNQLATLVNKLKLHKDSIVAIRATWYNDALFGQDIRYSGYLSVRENKDDDKPLSVILGTVTTVRYNAERGVCNVSIPAGKGKNTSYLGVAFWNDDERNGRKAFADNAQKLLTPEEQEDGSTKYARVWIVASAPKKNEYTDKNGNKKTATNFSAFRWGYAPQAPKKEESKKEEKDDFMDISDEMEAGLPWD